jgi:isopropylmalate/homocitrate/citramalate synthase
VGGCPFAPRATGNISTEELVYLMDRSGVSTGLDLEALIEVNHWFERILGRPMPSLVARAGNYTGAAAR